MIFHSELKVQINCKMHLNFSLLGHDILYDGFRRISATFEELEERVNNSDTDEDDLDLDDKQGSDEVTR